MRWKLWPILIIILLIPAFSFTDPSTLSSLELDLEFRGAAQVAGSYERVSVKTYEFPENDERQTTTCPVTPYLGTEGNHYTSFSFGKNEPIEFSYTCTIITKPVGVRVRNPTSFPLSSFPAEVKPYLEESKYVRINSEIAEKALELSANKNELFDVVSTMAYWVYKNIQYDRAYIDTAEESSYVLEVRAGACDEFSHLFIAMLRSLGIPARYVGGYAYGGSAHTGDFGPHGWAEVYFPSSGWVPFDPTYGQFGYVDASHIKLYAGTDESFPVQETNYSYFASPPAFIWQKIDPVVTIIAEEVDFTPVTVSLEMPEEANKNEYFLAKATLTSQIATASLNEAKLYYKPSNLDDDKGLQLAYGEENTTAIVFPGSSAEINWVLTAPTPNYKFPLVAVSGRQSEQKRIAIMDRQPSTYLSLSSDKTSYREGEQAKIMVMLSSSTYDGPVELIELGSGITGTAQLEAGTSTTVELTIPARDEVAIYSTSKSYDVLPLSFSDSKLRYIMVIPSLVSVGENFEVKVIAYSNEPVEVEVEFDGQSEKKTVTPSAAFIFQTSLSTPSIISANVKTLSGTETLRKFVQVAPQTELSLSPPSSLFKEASIFRLRPKIVNGGIQSLDTSFPWGNHSGASFTVQPNACGIHYYKTRVTYTDSLNATRTREFSNTINIDCNPLSQLIAKILKLLGIIDV